MRADKFFAEKFGSRTKSAEAIEKGLVLVNGKSIKAKDEIAENDEITFVTPSERFVSNGGYKLSRAVETFKLDCFNKVFVDIGASTGGFTDCLLQNGAKKVYAVDVGESLLHESLQTDARIVVLDNTNARYLKTEHFPEKIDGVVTDVSFISLRLILPVISDILNENGFAVVLIKPQFECDKKSIGKSGIVATYKHESIVKKVLVYALVIGLYPFGVINAPVRKGKNIEYVMLLKKTERKRLSEEQVVGEIIRLVKLNSEGELS